MKNCLLCESQQVSTVFTAENMPVFQNVTYKTNELAKAAPIGNIKLMICEQCGFVYNSEFDSQKLQFDESYESEQGYSTFYRNHLSYIVNLFKQRGFESKKIIEIGCGKGFFLETLVQSGFDVSGFDPAYSGNNPNIVKDYFSLRYANLSADLIVLRNILPHIQNPLHFLHTIAEAVNYNASIYIELASLNWILQHYAFWDIYYEFCNYFTDATLTNMFNKSEHGFLLKGQSQYVIADLKDLRDRNYTLTKIDNFDQFLKLNQHVHYCRENLLKRRGLALWGASGKGVAFASLVDPNAELVSFFFDINPKKHHLYVPKTAQKILSPNELKDVTVNDILVMNNNYFEEIKEATKFYDVNVTTIDSFKFHEKDLII